MLIDFPIQLRGLSGGKARKEAKELMVTLKLTEKKDALSMSLSGGQKRKLSLGCALITGAKGKIYTLNAVDYLTNNAISFLVLILDEPTSGMDVENRRMLWDMLLVLRNFKIFKNITDSRSCTMYLLSYFIVGVQRQTHHYFDNAFYGRGRYSWGSNRYYGSRKTSMLRYSYVSQEILW